VYAVSLVTSSTSLLFHMEESLQWKQFLSKNLNVYRIGILVGTRCDCIFHNQNVRAPREVLIFVASRWVCDDCDIVMRILKLTKYRLKAQVEKDKAPEWRRMKAQRQRHYQDY